MSDKERITNEADVQAHRAAAATEDETERTDPERRTPADTDEPDVERLDEAVGRAAELRREQRDQDVVQPRIPAPQPLEVRAVDHTGLARLERGDRRRSLAIGRDERELAEDLARALDRERDGVAEL